MRVLFVSGIFPPDHGGPATYVPLMATALSARGNTVVAVLTLSDTTDHNDACYDFRVIRLRRGLWRPFRWIRTVLAIRRLAKQSDVVYLNGLVFEGIIGARLLAGKACVVKVVGDLVWERARNSGAFSGDLDAFQRRQPTPWWNFLHRLQGWYTSAASAVITPSRYLAALVAGWGVHRERIKVVYNAAGALEPPPPAQPRFDLVTVARLVPWKGVAELVELAAARGWRLKVVGDGPLFAELTERARSTGAAALIQFTGHIPHRQVAAEIRDSRVFVLNSSYEGLPHIILEAKAAGVPVVATAAGGTAETIADGIDGFLVQPGDLEALAQRIDALLGDPALASRFVTEGYRQISERFSSEVMVTETEKVLSDVSAHF